MAEFVQLTKDIENASIKLDSEKTNTLVAQEKQKLLAAARDLVERLEGPHDGIWRVLYGPQGNAVLRAAFSMRIFEVFEEPETAHQLSEKTGSDKILVVRVMRVLCVLGIFKESGEETYVHNSRSELFTDPKYRTFLPGMGVFVPYMNKLPDYLELISFKNPGTSGHDRNLFQYAMETDMEFWAWLHTQPKELETFSVTMASMVINVDALGSSVSDLFPGRNEEIKEASGDSVVIVDVGGGRGKILNNLRNARPDLKGRMVVQDLPREVEGRKDDSSDGIESMAHDFFTPQPVKGANIYFFRHIFHDWPDAACQKILRQIIPAMRRGYSRLVIIDIVIPNQGASVFQSLLDIGMMAVSGMERSERHWRKLIAGEGLEVLSIRPLRGNDSILEAVLV